MSTSSALSTPGERERYATDGSLERWCYLCEVWQPLDAEHFRPDPRYRFNLTTRCRDCSRQLAREAKQRRREHGYIGYTIEFPALVSRALSAAARAQDVTIKAWVTEAVREKLVRDFGVRTPTPKWERFYDGSVQRQVGSRKSRGA